MGKENQSKKQMTAHWIVLPHEACCSQSGGPLGPMKVKLWWPNLKRGGPGPRGHPEFRTLVLLLD